MVHCDWNWPMETEKPKSSLEMVKSFHRSHHVVVFSEFPHYNTNLSLNPANSQTWALKHHVKIKFTHIYSRRFLENFLANHILQPALSNCAGAKIVGLNCLSVDLAFLLDSLRILTQWVPDWGDGFENSLHTHKQPQ